MHRIATAVAVTLFAAPAFAQQVTLSPEQVGEIFCIARLGNDMAPVEGLLTSGLTAAIAEAEARNDVIQKAHPDEKPPLGDGIPWQASPDVADRCTPQPSALSGNEAYVTLDYAFTSYPDANFSDTLILQLVDDAISGAKVWRIDNIGYGDAGDLRSILVQAFEN